MLLPTDAKVLAGWWSVCPSTHENKKKMIGRRHSATHVLVFFFVPTMNGVLQPINWWPQRSSEDSLAHPLKPEEDQAGPLQHLNLQRGQQCFPIGIG